MTGVQDARRPGNACSRTPGVTGAVGTCRPRSDRVSRTLSHGRRDEFAAKPSRSTAASDPSNSCIACRSLLDGLSRPWTLRASAWSDASASRTSSSNARSRLLGRTVARRLSLSRTQSDSTRRLSSGSIRVRIVVSRVTVGAERGIGRCAGARGGTPGCRVASDAGESPSSGENGRGGIVGLFMRHLSLVERSAHHRVPAERRSTGLRWLPPVR